MTQQKRVPVSLIHKWRNAFGVFPSPLGEDPGVAGFGLMLRSRADLQRRAGVRRREVEACAPSMSTPAYAFETASIVNCTIRNEARSCGRGTMQLLPTPSP